MLNLLWKFYLKYFLLIIGTGSFILGGVLTLPIFYYVFDVKDNILLVSTTIIWGCFGALQALRCMLKRNQWTLKIYTTAINSGNYKISHMRPSDSDAMYDWILSTWWVWDVNYFFPQISKQE